MTDKTTSTPTAVGQRLKSARQQSNLTLAEAARHLGFPGLAEIERDPLASSVTVELIRDAAELYQVTTDYLLGRSVGGEASESRIDILIAHFEDICRRRESLMLQIKRFQEGLPLSGNEWQTLAGEAATLADDLKSLRGVTQPSDEQGCDGLPQDGSTSH